MAAATRKRVEEALREVIDPEVGVNILDLGLVYGIDVGKGRVDVKLTMTSPACPLGEHVRGEAEAAIRRHVAATDVEVSLVWEPPWTPERMTAAARRQLGWADPD